MTEKNSSAASTLSTIDEQQIRTVSSECKVCEAPARYSYFGATACESCKMFFKRNAETKQAILICQYHSECIIDKKNRHSCASCRLKKCFANGMSIEMIRPNRPKKNEKIQKKKSVIDLLPIITVAINNPNQFVQIPALNLLRSNQSTLAPDQWNILSNLIHCFDQYTGNLFVQHLAEDPNTLPLGSHFECSSVRDFLTSMKSKIQLALEKNRDSFSISSHDRIYLLRTTVQYTTSLGGMFKLRQHRLLDYPSFYKCMETIFGPNAVIFARRVVSQLDPDDTFIKLVLAILAFSTTNYTIYTNNTLTKLSDTKRILFIQDTYAEIAWRYLLYKHNYHEAVIRFSNLIRCLFHMIETIVKAHGSKQYKDMIDTVINQVQQTLCL